MLIVFEGIDGCGKDTQISILKKRISFEYYKYPTKRYPRISDFLERKADVDPKSLVLLFLADIMEDQKEIEKRRARELVILDRYVFSTIAYEIENPNSYSYYDVKKLVEISDFLKPDLVFLIDLPPEIAQERKKKQKKEGLDRYEENLDYLKKVRENFLHLYEEGFWAKKWVKIDGKREIEEINKEISRFIR